MHKSLNVSIIIVSYESEKALALLLPSIEENVELIIVNNSTKPLSEDLKKSKHFTEIQNSENKGFGAACNIGVRAASKDFIFLLNPDTILDKGCITNLLNAADKMPSASAFTPKIIGRNNKEEFKRRSVLLNKKLWLKKPPSKTCEIPVMGGAAIFLRKENFIKIGGFDENIFLYHEDDDLSIRLKNIVGPLIYYPKSKVRHSGGNSSQRSPEIAKIKGFFMGKSRVYSMKKYGIKHYRIRCLLLALMQLLSIQVVFSARKRSKYLSFFRGTIQSLKG